MTGRRPILDFGCLLFQAVMYAGSSAAPDQKGAKLGEIPLKLERYNVEFAIWRKKVDKYLLEHNGTTTPGWACKMWGLPPIYGKVTSRKVPAAAATVDFNGTIYDAWVTTAPYGRSSPAFRLWYDPSLAFELKRSFVMSYMRSLEGRLDSDRDVEHAASFWEFLDIEFDERQRLFRFVAYYTVQPSFPHLFTRYGSATLLTSRPTKDGCFWRWSLTCSTARWWAGRSEKTCGVSSDRKSTRLNSSHL